MSALAWKVIFVPRHIKVENPLRSFGDKKREHFKV